MEFRHSNIRSLKTVKNYCTLRVSMTEAVTKLALVSARATSHWVDGGPQRFLSLDFIQNGADIQAVVPSDTVKALAGYYILFAMVDDIPSVGKIVRITPTPVSRPAVPSISITTSDATASEPGADTASFTLTRTGTTTAPMLVNYTATGLAVNGNDYNAISNFAVIPAGAFSTTVTLIPKDDSFVDGTENILISLANTAAYNAGPGTNVMITLADNEASPPSLSLQFRRPLPGEMEIMITGAATRLYAVESSTNLAAWKTLTTVLTATNTVRLTDP